MSLNPPSFPQPPQSFSFRCLCACTAREASFPLIGPLLLAALQTALTGLYQQLLMFRASGSIYFEPKPPSPNFVVPRLVECDHLYVTYNLEYMHISQDRSIYDQVVYTLPILSLFPLVGVQARRIRAIATAPHGTTVRPLKFKFKSKSKSQYPNNVPRFPSPQNPTEHTGLIRRGKWSVL